MDRSSCNDHPSIHRFRERARPPWRQALACLLLLAGLAQAACGGGSTPTAPSSTASTSPLPSTSACGAIGGTASAILGIINGTACSTTSTSVVLVNLRDKNDVGLGSCSGTVIAPRAVLTAAHCLVGDTSIVRIYVGSGDQVPASSFKASPAYRDQSASSLDVGVILTATDLNRPAVPLLASRDAVVGEAAVIAGWGQDEKGLGTTLRAGTATIATIGPYFLETLYTAGSGGVCSGDSGGPLLLSQQGVWAVAGVTSATSTSLCTSGTDFYANLRNPDILTFVLDLVPDATRK